VRAPALVRGVGPRVPPVPPVHQVPAVQRVPERPAPAAERAGVFARMTRVPAVLTG